MRYFHLVLFIVVSSTIGCSNQEFAGDNARKVIKPPCSKLAKSSDKECKPDPPPPPPPPPPPVQTHEAVFAVRNLACALCHATVDSSVISDFAATTTDGGSAQALANMFFVVKHGDSQTKKPEIKGKFIVPDVQTSTYASSMTAGKSNCAYSGLNLANSTYVKTSLVEALKTCVEPFMTWGSATEKFVKKTTVAINPVSSPDEIKAIASAEAATLASAGFATVGTSTVEGITGSKLTGFKSSAAVKCEGAVVFDGPVLLKDTTISTQKGCRIYSTGSIFVFGQLNVKGPDDSAHIQLLSPLFIGFDISINNMAGRLTHTLNAKQAFSRGSGTSVASLIAADAKKIGAEALLGGGSSSYKRVAAAAPVVYSKSSGQFSGLIIAEQFLGKIGSLSFTFDPVFKPRESAPALFPEIKSELVSVSKD